MATCASGVEKQRGWKMRSAWFSCPFIWYGSNKECLDDPLLRFLRFLFLRFNRQELGHGILEL